MYACLQWGYKRAELHAAWERSLGEQADGIAAMAQTGDAEGLHQCITDTMNKIAGRCGEP